MRNLSFDYVMKIKYSEPVDICYYTIKCIPKDTSRQSIHDLKIEMEPDNKPEWGDDSFGNKYIFGCNPFSHDSFTFHISGHAETNSSDCEEKTSEREMSMYRHPHGLNKPGVELKKYFAYVNEELGIKDKPITFNKACALARQLHTDFIYEKNITNCGTGAEDAWKLGKGVCQDYAHILIALLHMAGCSARYVTGLLLGEGESHAWVEVACNGRWIGIDPTNNCIVDDSYIRIGVGRDAGDCQLNRGIMHGGGNQKQTIQVLVSDAPVDFSYYRRGFARTW